MGPASRSGTAGPAAAPAVRGGVVSRPGLFGRLGAAGRVTEVSAPAGSGKTLLLRSWIAGAGLAGRAAWVAVQGEERDPQRFWLSVFGALRDTAAGSTLVRPLTAAPGLDGGLTRWKRSAAGRRSSWPGGTAGPRSRSPVSPTWRWA